MFKSLFGVVSDVATIVTSPIKIASDVTRVATKPLAELIKEVTDSIEEDTK